MGLPEIKPSVVERTVELQSTQQFDPFDPLNMVEAIAALPMIEAHAAAKLLEEAHYLAYAVAIRNQCETYWAAKARARAQAERLPVCGGALREA